MKNKNSDISAIFFMEADGGHSTSTTEIHRRLVFAYGIDIMNNT